MRTYLSKQSITLYYISFLKFLETFLTPFLIIVFEDMLFYFPHIISKREANLIKPLCLLFRIDRTRNPYKVEVDYCVKCRELSMVSLKKPYLRIETIGRDNGFVKGWEGPYISRLSPPETSRIHGVVAWWPSITAISIVSFIQNIHGNLPLIKDEIF